MSITSKVKTLMKAPVGAGTVLQGLTKLVPHLGSFISGAYSAGYAADQILDFVRSRTESPSERRKEDLLRQRSSSGEARPDEKAMLSSIEQSRAPLEAAFGAGKGLAQIAGGLGVSSAVSGQQQQEQALQQQQVDLAQADQEARTQDREAERAQRFDLEREKIGSKEKMHSEKLAHKERLQEKGFKSKEESRLRKEQELAKLEEQNVSPGELEKIDSIVNALRMSNIKPEEGRATLQSLGFKAPSIRTYERRKGATVPEILASRAPQAQQQMQQPQQPQRANDQIGARLDAIINALGSR